MPSPENNAIFELPNRTEKVIVVRISRRTLIAVIVSILLHLSLLWIFAPKLFSMGAPAKESPPFEITLGPPQQKPAASAEPTPATPSPAEIVEPSKSKPRKIIKEKPNRLKSTKTLEAEKKPDFTLPKPPETTVAQPSQLESIAPLPGEDMQSYIRRQKEAKLAKQGASKQDMDEILASNNTQSESEKRDAKIRENLKFDGTNGIFQIREMGLHHAQFSFKGWKSSMSNARLEIIDVNVPDGSDGKREVIAKMIEIIRREYSGDFNWDSWRLQRVVVLSARVEDTAALESFMMTEFFSSGAWRR